MFDGRFRVQVEKVVRPVGETLRKTGLSPDHLTLLGMLVAVAAAVSIGAGALQLGLFLVICSALPDLLDGALAKASNSASQRGAFFDSVVDRVTDALLFGGVAWFFATTKDPRLSLVPFAIMGVSMLISYERAKAES
ncbi:MAG: CDP-alcohol phosphatidyltransferase family protein, partial [Actinobacteria bacterium]|nr:CDP-alcohol phosphatidyltransferase family protein [Actinomycetota bacterium]